MKDKENIEYEDILSVFRTFANAVKDIHACDGQFLLIDKINHHGFIEGFERITEKLFLASLIRASENLYITFLSDILDGEFVPMQSRRANSILVAKR